ncbi:MAG: hypothetical protein ABI430_03170 [Candidatus Taylorbacteria bacterium]
MDENKTSAQNKNPVVIAFLICVIALSITYIASTALNFKKTSELPKELTLAEKKAEVIARLQSTDTQPLTKAERSEIVDFVSRGGATYTEAERAEITRILRAK